MYNYLDSFSWVHKGNVVSDAKTFRTRTLKKRSQGPKPARYAVGKEMVVNLIDCNP